MNDLFGQPLIQQVESPITRQQYYALCEQRWYGEALRDAKKNWLDWYKMHSKLRHAMKEFRDNPGMRGVSGEYHNPDCTLTAYLWKLQEAWQPDKSCLMPFLDFEENFQKVFLRRGLIAYCTLILKSLDSKPSGSV